MISSPNLFHLAMDACLTACNAEPSHEIELKLASVAVLFSQVAEHLQRGYLFTPEIVARCKAALPLVPNDRTREAIERMLSRLGGCGATKQSFAAQHGKRTDAAARRDEIYAGEIRAIASDGAQLLLL